MGLSSSLIIVPSSNQPDNVEDGSLSFSVWVLLNDSVDGILLAKGSEDGSTIYYGISVTADGDNYIIKFYYLPTTMDVSLIKKIMNKIIHSLIFFVLLLSPVLLLLKL